MTTFKYFKSQEKSQPNLNSTTKISAKVEEEISQMKAGTQNERRHTAFKRIIRRFLKEKTGKAK
jgi:hypothetical protein